MSKQKLYESMKNNQKNIRFGDFVTLIEAFSFELDRSKGSRHMYKHLGIPKIINIQDDNGKAKPYQHSTSIF